MTKKRLALLALLALLIASACRPMIRNYKRNKKERQLAGGGAGSAFAPYYDTETVVTVTGKVIRVENFIAKSMRVKAVRVFVQTQDKIQEVHLGPIWYIAKQKFTLRAGDIITVTGSLVDDKIMAQQFEQNGEIFLLRNQEGEPEWFKSMNKDSPIGGPADH